MELLAALVDEAAVLVFETFETWIDGGEDDVSEEAEELDEEDRLEEEADVAGEFDADTPEADVVADAVDCSGDALLEGLFGVVVSEGRSLVVACLRSLAGACRFPMLVCTHSPKQARTRSHRLCIFVARSGVGCGLQAPRSISIKGLHVFVRARRAQLHRESMLRLGKL